ncbi:SAM-dependent methyltransferase [Streptomyces alkaliphilus]|uniref:SAM-dependent methyltransferase n=1 Tax=Streptomyces alkaliphilus TaxID=1472722 RepID=UPI00117BF67D|nr:SAM-dependent methyltransferase [Streptomyces alkaliphilus]
MTDDASSTHRRPNPGLDTSVPHSARMWNYWLGGKDNYEADRIAADQFAAAFPAIADNARAFRHFLARAIRHLAEDAGIRQFLDIGTGLPTVDNTHEVAQRVAPESRIVYVDNDPLVLAHARALLTSTPEGATAYLDADLRDTDAILRAAADTLDFDRPIALVLSGILGHYDEEVADDVLARLTAALPSGSHLVICDGTDTSPELNEAQRMHNERGAVVYHLRSHERIARFFTGMELVEPGVVPCYEWRPEPSPFEPPAGVHAAGAVGRKP